MKISYDGDQATALRFTQMAQQEWGVLRPVSGRGRLSRVFRQPWGEATAFFTYGGGMDGIHISARAIPGAGQMFSFLSGAVISAGQLTSTGLLSYAPTVNSIERFAYPTHPLVSGRLTVPSHASMPTRIEGGLADSQYTVQAPSKYTGKMCQLVQLILGYGKLREDTVITTAIRKFKDSLGKPLILPPSVIWTKVNIAKGVQNTFRWEWARTHGVFTRTYVVEGVTYKQYWLIEISTAGVKAMPLQIEPVTALPEFRAYILAEIAKSGHKKYFEDVKLVLDTFGGFPSNEAFLSVEPAIVAQRVTILGPEAMPQYVNGTAVSYDHGWAFNDAGNFANTICLETFGGNSWHMAHHCQITISWDAINARPKASFSVIESGAAPVGKWRLKVGETALDACISYNSGLKESADADYSARPRATRTAMFVFWRRDRLEVLRWTEGHTEDISEKIEIVDEYGHYLREKWGGVTGISPGFFCTLHDGRVVKETQHEKFERTLHIENEYQRVIDNSPSSDIAERYRRSFWAWTESRTEAWYNGDTNNSCAFTPLGDRSAFYLVTMTTKPEYRDTRGVYIYQQQDPYNYAMSDTYIWNWDFGTKVGEKFPVTHAGTTVQGIVDVVWDRGGSRGKAQLEIYGIPYIWGPGKYKGGYYHGLTPTDEKAMAEWTAFTGKAEWAGIGTHVDTSYISAFGGNTGPSYAYTVPTSTTLSVYFVSMQTVGEVFRVTGSYSYIYQNYNYWFDRSPNSDGDYQTMWAFKNYFGGKFYQLYSTDVNNQDLTVTDGYALDPSDFPTFIGVVGDIPA